MTEPVAVAMAAAVVVVATERVAVAVAEATERMTESPRMARAEVKASLATVLATGARY